MGLPPVVGVDQDTVALVLPAVAEIVGGAPGGVVAAPRLTNDATDGVPLSLTMKTMYDAGGASAAFEGIWASRLPDPAVKVSGTKCWLMSLWCVVAASETRLTERTDAASGELIEMLDPYVALLGMPVIVGRGPLERYGGE